MSALLSGAIFFTLGCYSVASILVLARLIRGPRAQDRVFALDLLYLHAVLVMLVLLVPIMIFNVRRFRTSSVT